MPPKKNEEQDSLNLPEAQQEETSNVPEAPKGLMYGNKDATLSHAFPKDWKDSVVVWQCGIEQMNGGVVEVPNTHTLQTYTPDVYDRLSNADLKERTSFFSESKMKVVVLHDPRG